MKQAILCVDDDRIILNSLKTQLKSAFGNTYAYEMAENGEDALELIEELSEDGSDENIVVIISDWLMPGMKGDEFLIKIHEKFPGIVTVMLTGQADEEAIQRAQKHANLHACVLKPWVEDELIQTIKSGLNLL